MHQSIAKHIQNHANRKYERNINLTRKLPGFKSILLAGTSLKPLVIFWDEGNNNWKIANLLMSKSNGSFNNSQW